MVATHFFGATGGTPQQTADAVRAFWFGVRSIINQLWTLQVDPLVYEIDAATNHPVGVHTTSTPAVTGGATGDPSPGFVQGLVSWHTGFFVAGRELVGRTFIPGVDEGDTLHGAPDATYISAVNTAAAALIATATATLQVYSPTHHIFVGAATGVTGTKYAVLKSRR
jgi:hypothetical protein